MPGYWHPIKHQPSFAIDTMLLLTDGSVLAHEYETANFHKLIPDDHGDYTKGTWHPVSPLPANAPVSQNGPTNAPLYFASAVLRDGRVFVAGGEYNGGAQVDLLAVEVYDPVSNLWTSAPNPPGFTNIGDSPACVLPHGHVIMGNINTVETAIFDPETMTWAVAANKHDTSSEETWTLLPDNTIIVAEVNGHPSAEKYLISSNQWVKAGSIPAGHDLVLNAPVSIEIGPAILLPNRTVFAMGATGHTAIYHPPLNPPDPGNWTPGPDFPVDSNGNLLRAFDAPACLLINGRVLCAVGRVITAGPNDGWSGEPVEFFEYDGTFLNPVASPASVSHSPTYNCRLLPLPTGQVLLSNCTNSIEVYNPDGAPDPAWRPHITEVPRHLHPGQTYKLHGRQLNGLSQAVCYGDDAQMATNYPLVRLKHTHGHEVHFCRTFHHSTMAVATGGAPHHTHFEVPLHVPHGEYELTVIANGIHSHPVDVHVE